MKRTKQPKEKEKLLLSFSGGETSAYMTQWCLKNWQDKYDMEVVFANTGEENEETLEFVKKCDEILGFNTTWVESVVHHGQRKQSTHKVVDFESASRDGEPFEEVIKKYTIPNQASPHCTRELKTNPIKSYIKQEVGWDSFYTAIGIRKDEVDRMSANAEKKKYIYPLIQNHPTTKQNVNKYWSEMPFRLELKGWQGNCKACWKKSFRKLYQIAIENPEAFDNMIEWEEKYEDHVRDATENPEDVIPLRFYRNNKSARQIIKEAREKDFKPPKDDSKPTAARMRSFFEDEFDEELDVGGGCEETCEPFS